MATIRERIDSTGKKTYHVQIRLRGFPPQTQSFSSKTVAKQWASQVETELREGRYLPRAQALRHTVKEMLEEYRKRVLIPLKPQELKVQGPQLDWWIDKIGAYGLADITPAVIAKYRDELLQTPIGKKTLRQRSPATVVRYMALLSHAFNVAVKEWQWLPESPMPKVAKPKISNGRLRYLTEDEQKRLIATTKQSANHYLYTIVSIALSTGMRLGEIMNLRWRNLLLEDNEEFGLILLETTKNGEPRGVPIVQSAHDAIKVLKAEHARQHKGRVKLDALLFPSEDDPKKPVEIRKAWTTALKRAEISNFRFHDLRHTTASYLAMEGATAPQIAEILGHKTLQMVKRYSHFNKAHIADVLTRMTTARIQAGKSPGRSGSDSDNPTPEDSQID